ncbi:hypothetical protein SAY86_000737 [Trapa natans]|uniref:WRKY19-like zinc finger domain-containing protein n=1 Tax=Trapa natans TaxID=22666 RepID=A0AAN7RE46_TRANT|nr:hypothetical protein SAY86_000737 [Trapa natans]
MDPRFPELGFAAGYSFNAFKNLGHITQVGLKRSEHMDTVLRLDSPTSLHSQFSGSRGVKRKWNLVDGSLGQKVDSSLSLGLRRSSSSSDSKSSSATACTTMSSAKENEEESSMDLELDFTLHLGNERTPNSKRVAGSFSAKAPGLQPKVDLELSLSMGRSESNITSTHQGFLPSNAQNLEEGVTSLNRDASLLLNQVTARRIGPVSIPINAEQSPSMATPKSTVTCSSGISPSKARAGSSKTCQVEGCGKGARGASGRCISHGGGRRCQKPGCQKGAEGRTIYCKAHGGGRRCEFLGCTKSAEGRTDFCIAHGGGRRCSYEGGCNKAARGKSGLCIRHGGGKRCQREGCTRSAEGLSGLCISHGGGRRCQFSGCTKGAQGTTMFCKAHGGGKRCSHPGCTKGAEGSTPFCKGHGGGKRCSFQGGGMCAKSVHGGTNFCVAHGGGKRCAVLECTKSARGRTDYCVRHGGGKRCKFEGCGKSAQGSTDFCKAHGGGKRCLWGHAGSDHGTHEAVPCNAFSRGKTGLCNHHGGLVQDKRVHGGINVGPIVQGQVMKDAAGTAEEMNIDAPLRQEVLPPAPAFVPEGRVHGGSLMAMLTVGLAFGQGSIDGLSCDPSDTKESKYHMPSQSWL